MIDSQILPLGEKTNKYDPLIQILIVRDGMLTPYYCHNRGWRSRTQIIT